MMDPGRLIRSLNGLKQAPRCWNMRFVQHLKPLGFKASDADSSLFIRNSGSDTIVIALYVDDGLVASTKPEDMRKFLDELRREFNITTKPASYYLGLEIEKHEGKIEINQRAYTKKILERFGRQ